MTLTENSKIVRFFSTIIKPRAQIFNLIIISTIVTLIAIVPYTRYNGIEAEVPLVPITTEKIKEWGTIPTRVTAGLYINNFPTLDFVNSDFIFDGILWFEFDPALISLNTVSKFAFEKGEILYSSEPYTQLSDNKFFARYNLRVRFKSDMNYKLFPFDDHRIDIVLINRVIEPSEMIFWSFSPYFDVAPSAQFTGWHLYDTLVNMGISESIIERTGTQKVIAQPRVVFSICLKREGTRNILLILLPLFIIYFISLFSFSFDPIKNPGTIFSLASAGVTGLLSYRFVIEGMTPKVGYFVLSDKIFILFLLATLCEFALAVLLMQLKKMTPFISLLRGITYVLLNTIFIIAWYYFLIRS